ncbi:MAG: hypothetical protein ACXW2E_01885 [Nitrososphaeraceae archaeon]
MKIYAVGGFVRDSILGIPAKDRDFVVVGATPEDMLKRGFVQVGASFPVFLDKNGEEYALARTERKTGVGYNGFSTKYDPSITLEDDLNRRDLTINSIAQDLETGEYIDPFGGINDLQNGILRHTSEAFQDDPVRVLRTARFAARYGFKIVPSTVELMKNVVHELEFVPAERVWAEFAKGLMEDRPDIMLEVLRDVKAFAVNKLQPYNQAFPYAVNKQSEYLPVRFASIAHGFKEDDYEACCIPNECVRLSKLINTYGRFVRDYNIQNTRDRLDFIMNTRLINATASVWMDQLFEFINWAYGKIVVDCIHLDMKAIHSVDVTDIVNSCSSGKEIGEKLFNARLVAMN